MVLTRAETEMANRSYLYSLSNRPTSYSDRPETISGLSEWSYAVPFSYRTLLSGDPRLCSSLVSDGFRSEPPDRKTRLYAISSNFDLGYASLKKFLAIVRAIAHSSARTRLKKFLAILRAIAGGGAPDLIDAIEETQNFLEAHRNRYLLLETIELDSMSEQTEQGLRTSVERELAACLRTGAAIEALPADVNEAGVRLKAAARRSTEAPLDAFYGLVLNDHFDSTRDGETHYPLGLYWSDVLYFALQNREQFEANR